MGKIKHEEIEDTEIEKTKEDSKSLLPEELKKVTKLEIRRILKNNKTNGKIDWFNAISEFREKYNLPKWISIEEFASFATHIELTGKEKANFDEYLKFLKEVDLNIIKNENIDIIDINKTVNNQLQDSKQGLVELVSNGADSYGLSIGRFGKGFFGALAFLNDEKSELKLQTKMKEGKAFEITFKKVNGKYSFHSKTCNKKENGTKIKLNKSFSLEEIQDFKLYLVEKYGTNKFIKVKLNQEHINNLDGYIYKNGKSLDKPKDEVNITINENGFEVIDKGIGMSAEIISTKLLRPKDTTKERIVYTEEQLKNEVPKEISFFYKTGNMEQVKNNENSRKHTKIKLQMSGVEIESFDIPTTHNIETFVLELPKGTWVPDSRNQISPTKEIVVAIKTMIHKINDFENTVEKMKLLEIAEIIINELSKRAVNTIKKEDQIDFVAKESFKEIRQSIENQNLVCIANFDGIKDILGEKSGVVYIPPSFMELDVSKIPEVQKIENVENAKIPFFLTDFSENTEKVVIVHKSGVLINKKYAVSPELITTINNLINLNVGYELPEDIVFYGRIAGGKVEFEIEKNKSLVKKEASFGLKTLEKDLTEFSEIERKKKKIELNNKILILATDLIYKYDKYNIADIGVKKELLSKNFFIEQDFEEFKQKLEYFLISGEKDIYNLLDDNFIDKYLNFINEYSEEITVILLKLDKQLGGNENRQKILNKFFEIAEKSFSKKSVVDLFTEFVDSDLPIFDIINIDWENLENVNLEELYKKDIRFFIGVLEARIGKKINSISDVIEIDGGIAISTKIDEENYYLHIIKLGKLENTFKCHQIASIHRIDGRVIFLEQIKYSQYTKNVVIEILNGKQKDYGPYKNISNFKKIENGCSFEIEENGEKFNVEIIDGEEMKKKIENESINYFEKSQRESNICKTLLNEVGIFKYDITTGFNEIKGKYCFMVDVEFGENYVVENINGKTNKHGPYKNIKEFNIDEGGLVYFVGEIYNINEELIESSIIEVINGKTIKFEEDIIGGDIKSLKKIKGGYIFKCNGENRIIYNGQDFTFGRGSSFGPEVLNSIPTQITGLAKLLQNDGELLDIEAGLSIDLFGGGSIKLSEIIALNKLQNTSINGISQNSGLENGKNELLRKYPGLGNSEEINQFQRLIEGTIISQDKASNMWTKELPANSLDVSSKVDIKFFQNKNGNFLAQVKDDCGISPEQVFQYLLNPDKSSKQPGEGVGMFGQGFFTAFVGIEELNIKTGNGEKTTYLKIKPLEINGKIVDFEVKYNITDEKFKGTIIERVDNNTGFDGNLEALLCLQTIQTNLGNVEKGEINYNGERVNKSENKSLVSNIEVPNIGNLRLFKTRSNKEKLTLKGYYLSEIKGEYLDMLPDWIIEYIKKQNLSLDLPIGLEPTQSRNSITNFDENIKTLKPYLFRLFIDYILREYLAGRLTIPMMSLDFWRSNNSSYNEPSEKYNKLELLNNSDFEKLKDKQKMVEFLVMVDFEINGEKTSLMKMKIEQDTKLAQGKTKKSIINDFLAKANFKKGEVVSKKVLEKNIGKEKYNKFLEYINDKFGKLFDEVILYRPDFEVVEGEGFTASAGGGTINIEIKALKNWIENYEKDEKTREYIEKIITHELTHLEEQKLGKTGGTHTDDPKYNDSFLSMNKVIFQRLAKIKLEEVVEKNL